MGKTGNREGSAKDKKEEKAITNEIKETRRNKKLSYI